MSRLNELWHRGTEDDWEEAVREYWTVPGVSSQRALEEQMDNIHESRTTVLRDVDRFYKFLKEELYPWKMDRLYVASQQENLERYHVSTPHGIDRLRQYLLITVPKWGSVDINEVYKRMSVVGGMGIPVASGCLALLFPEHFGTLDRFCLRASLTVEGNTITDYLRVTEDVTRNPDHFFDKYEDALRLHVAKLITMLYREKARDLNAKYSTDVWTPRRVEKVVWTLRDS